MSTQDISMVCDVLLGISNPNKEIRTNSVNKLQELSNNLGALTFCLIEIASKTATNPNEKTIKTTALILGRKIVETKSSDDWKTISDDIKTGIKTKSFTLLNSEVDPYLNSRICDLIQAIMVKILDCEEEWPEIKNLAFSIINFDPSDNSKAIQIRTLIKLLTSGVGYMYEEIQEKYNVLIPYLEKLFDSDIDMKVKTCAADLVNELISFCDNDEKNDELKYFKEIVKKILNNIYKCSQMSNMPEDCVKTFLEDCIESERIEPSLFKPIFPEMFTLSQSLISKKDYNDEKIRELSFELILSLVEVEEHLLVKKRKATKYLYDLLDMLFNYALEFEKEVDKSWANPSGNVYDSDMEESSDDKIFFALSLFDRIISCTGIEYCEPEMKKLLNNYMNKSWEYQTVCFYFLITYSNYDQEFEKAESLMKIIYNATSNPQPKLRFAAIHCLNKFCDNYNPTFQTDTIKDMIPLLKDILKTETILKIQCEIISTLTSFIQFTTSDALKPYMKELFELLFTLFQQGSIPLIIRKLVLESILEIISTMEEEITPLAPVAFDLLSSYFTQAFKSKSGLILYGVLIECITSLGIYVKDKYYKIVPDIVNCIIQIVKGFDTDSFQPIRADLTNSLERLLPVLQENFKNLLPSLIETVITLIKMRPQMSISSTPTEQFDINNILKDDEEDKEDGKEIKTEETEELASSLSVLNTIIESVGEEFAQYVDKVEPEVFQLIDYKPDTKVRCKSAKILPNLINVINNQEVKMQKGKKYISLLIQMINNETDNHVCEKFFKKLKEVIENCGQILNKNELNELFSKIAEYFGNLKIKRDKLIEKKNKKNKKHKDDDEDDENIDDLINEDIEQLENIQEEIADNMGILLKTHKQISDEIVSKLIKEIIPNYFNSQNMFEVKMSLNISDDLIEFIGQDMLGNETWNFMYQIITKLVTVNDAQIRQAASYGIGNFARFTTNNFDNYSKGLIDSLYNAMNIKDTNAGKEDENEDYNEYGLAFDNMVAALGKIIYYQSNSNIVQAGFNELITKWIMNLPIKYDETEQEQQHDWLVDIFLNKRELIPENCYEHYFATLAKIYNTKMSNDKINKKIFNIFNDYVKKEDKLKQIVDLIYNKPDTDEVIKNKLKKLIV